MGSHWIGGKNPQETTVLPTENREVPVNISLKPIQQTIGPVTRDMVPKPVLLVAVQFVAKQGTESLHAACSKTNCSEETLYFNYVQIHSNTFSYSRLFKDKILEINHVGDMTPAPPVPKFQEC